MKITEQKRPKSPTTFGDLNMKDTFILQGVLLNPFVYMRTDHGNNGNAVNLNDGLRHFFDANVEIVPVNAELVWERA